MTTTAGRLPAALDLAVYRGDPFTVQFNFDRVVVPAEFTGQVRANRQAATVLASFTFAAGATTSELVASLTAANTATLPVAAVYDIAEGAYTLFAGALQVKGQVTQ